MESIIECVPVAGGQPVAAPAPVQLGEAAAPFPPSDRTDRGPRPLAPRVEQALIVLLEAYQYAQDLRLDPWDFAVELPTLRPLGITNSDCRWLMGRGLVECGFELTLAGDERRSFRPCRNFKLSKRTCLVLAEAGVALANGQEPSLSLEARTSNELLVSAATTAMRHPLSFPEVIAASSGASRPLWDRDRQQLRVGKVIVKQFKVPAPNQEAVLAAFEEEEWPPRIDDPLPPQPEQDPKRRLHDTINSLNRNQKHPLVRFLGDGSGQGVRWEFISTGHDSPPPR